MRTKLTTSALVLVCSCSGTNDAHDDVVVAKHIEGSASDTGAACAVTPPPPARDPRPPTPPPSSSSSAAASGLTSSDPRVLWWIDPRVPFAQLAPGVSDGGVHAGQTSGYINIRDLSDSFSLNGIELIARGSDPLNAAKAAYRIRTQPDAPLTGGQWHKTEILSFGEGPNVVKRGVDTWIALAIRLNDDMFADGNPGMSLFDLHKPDSATNEGDQRGNSPFAIYVGGDGALDVAIKGMRPDADLSTWYTPEGALQYADFPVPPTGTQWVKLVFKMKLHYDATQGPYTKAWVAIGDGPLVQIVDRAGSNSFNDESPYMYQKFGTYLWDDWPYGVGSPTRSIDSKGCYIFEERPGTAPLDEVTLRRLLDEI